MHTEIKKKVNAPQTFMSVTPCVMTVVICTPANDNTPPDLPPALALRAAA